MSMHISTIKADLHSPRGTLYSEVAVYNDDGGIAQIRIDGVFSYHTSVIISRNSNGGLQLIMTRGTKDINGLEHLFDKDGKSKRYPDEDIIFQKLTTDRSKNVPL